MATPDTVLVTRPAGQQHDMMERLDSAGYDAVHVPALRIESLPLADADRRLLMDLDQYHAVFFVSTNAVALGVAAMDDYWPQWPVGVHWLAVGEATARAMEQAGLPAERPAHGNDSESVLALPCLQALNEKKVLVLRGEGGREVFAQRLRDRGARVDYISLYRRLCDDRVTWPGTPVAAVLVTSVESWHCLQKKAGASLSGALIVAGSERIAAAIRDQGHGRVAVAASPRDEDMLECLKRNLKNG